MNLKTILLVTILIVVAYYVAPVIEAIFIVDTDYCEKYTVDEEGEYIIGYGNRLKAVSEGCY